MSFYPSKINQRFLDPLYADEIELADAIGTNASFVCGAVLRISLKIDDGKVSQARFKVAGCGFLVAAADFVCEKVQNLIISEIEKINVVERLEIEFGAAPPEREHCFELCANGLKTAISDYRAKENAAVVWNGENALVCSCFGVSERTIEAAISENNLTTVAEVTHACRAGGGCGSCQMLIAEILDDFWREQL